LAFLLESFYDKRETVVTLPELTPFFHPVFTDEAIKTQINIIKNERNQRKYFPGSDELSQYTLTKWLKCVYFPKNQLFGNDEDLASVTPDRLRHVHHKYQQLPLAVFIGGTFNEKTIDQLAENIPERESTLANHLQSNVSQLIWQRLIYHEATFRDLDNPVYHFASIFPSSDCATFWTINFLLELLTDNEHGALTEWIHKDRGWSYGIEASADFDRERLVVWIVIPVNGKAAVETIRHELFTHLRQATADANRFATTKRRLLLQQCFDFETLTSRMNRSV